MRRLIGRLLWWFVAPVAAAHWRVAGRLPAPIPPAPTRVAAGAAPMPEPDPMTAWIAALNRWMSEEGPGWPRGPYPCPLLDYPAVEAAALARAPRFPTKPAPEVT